FAPQTGARIGYEREAEPHLAWWDTVSGDEPEEPTIFLGRELPHRFVRSRRSGDLGLDGRIDQGAVVADQLAIERDAAAITFLHHLTGELHPRPQENEALRMGLGWGEAVVTEQVGVDFDTTT